MANPFFSGRIPLDLYKRIEQHIEETGQSKTDLLINALSTYLNHPVVRPEAGTGTLKQEQRFRALEERITALELSSKKFSFDNNVISLDNKAGLQLQNKNPDNTDNYDNRANEPPIATSLPLFNTSVLNNHFDNTDNDDNKNSEVDNSSKEPIQAVQNLLPEVIPISFENVTAGELLAATELKRFQLDNHKRKITAKYQKIGQSLEEKKLLEFPEKIETSSPIIINGYPYDLFYLGQNEKGNNLWSAIPYDNERYQLLSQ